MRGSSLVETILAIFVLVIAVSFSALSFHGSMRYQRVVQRKAEGLAFGETVLDQAREWSRVPSNFGGAWTMWSSVTNSSYPDYEVRVAVADRTVAMPCSELALGRPAPERRSLDRSFKVVEATIFYKGQPDARLNTLIGEPERLATSVSVTPVGAIPSQLAKDGVLEFEAKALDSNNQVIPDVFFQWTTAPINGNGTVEAGALGTRATLSNVVLLEEGSNRYTGGKVQVKAFCIVRGREISGLSPPVDLQQ